MFTHFPVMMAETLALLAPQPGGIYVDGTLGGSGHARAVADRIGEDGLLIGIDQDPDAIENAKQAMADSPAQVRLFQANFTALPWILSELGVKSVDGILLDLGLSFHQIIESGRGFSFQSDEPLDMRMDPDGNITAGDIINQESVEELTRIFKEYGEERWARRISKNIVRTRGNDRNDRSHAPAWERSQGSSSVPNYGSESGTAITTTRQLADLVRDAVPGGHRPSRIHPATRVFMALRIHVNQELERLQLFLDHVAADQGAIIRPGGRLCVLAFHSLEDRIVKRAFRAMASPCDCPTGLPECVCGRTPFMRILTRKPVRPGTAENEANPLARSARLRTVEKR